MTKTEFLEALKETSQKMIVIQKGKLLRFYDSDIMNYNCFCPITAVCFITSNKIYDLSEWPIAALDLELDNDLAADIVGVADYDIVHYSKLELRKELELAMGL